MADYLSFEEVIDELQIDEEELKRLISQGELRGFRDGMSMKFKRADVVNLKQGRNTEPTIILTDSDHAIDIPESSEELLIEDSSTDDTVLNIDGFMDESSEEIMIGSSDDLLITPSADSEEAIPTVEVPSLDDSGDSSSIEFYESSDEDTGALMEIGASSEFGGTESFELIDEDSGEDTGAVALVEDSEEFDGISEDDIAPVSSTSGRSARSSRRLAAAVALQPKQSHVFFTATLLTTTIILFVPGAILLNLVKGVEPEWVMGLAQKFNGLTEFFFKTFNG